MHARGENLVKMANQIGLFFASQHPDDPADAARAVAAHLKLFWAPAMRRGLVDQQGAPAGEAMLPVVRQALTTHGHDLVTDGAHIGGEMSEAFPAGGGDAG
jgi:formate dehydrogenase subunit delta